MQHSRSLSRQEKIVQLLLELRTVSVKDLVARFKVSEWTIRRDLTSLEERRLIERNYGEVKLIDARKYASFVRPKVEDMNTAAAKALIGRAAARLVQDGQHIALSAGTTTTEVARALKERDGRFCVVTNALNIAMELSAGKSIRVTCTGGEVNGDYHTLTGPVAERALKAHFFDVAIIGVSGIALREGLTVNSQLNAVTLEIMLHHSKKVIVVADGSKFGVVRFAHLAAIDFVDTIVTDAYPPEAFVEHLKSSGTGLIVAAEGAKAAQ